MMTEGLSDSWFKIRRSSETVLLLAPKQTGRDIN